MPTNNSGAAAMPYSLEAEQAVLGSILIDPECMEDVVSIVKQDYFYLPQHKAIFSSMMAMFTGSKAKIDPVVIADALAKEGLYDAAGGREYLLTLRDSVPSTANVKTYAKIVEEQYYLRSLITVSQNIIETAVSNNSNASDLLEYAEQKIYDIRQGSKDDDPKKLSDVIVNDVYDRLHKITGEEKEKYQAVPSGFSLLDRYITGLGKSDLILIGARPAMGKTAFAVNLIRQELQNDSTFQEEKRKPTIAMFSLEMNRSEILERFAASLTGIKGQNIRTGNVNEEELRNLMLFVNDDTQGLYINDNPNITTAEIESQLLKLKEQQGHLDLVVIDYLQLINSNLRTDNRQQEVSQISRDIKKIAKSLEVPIISLVQLSRSLEARQDKRPTLSDIRESGSIEQDSDIVMFLYRDDYYERDDTSNDDDGEDGNVSEIEVIVAKNRQGERATVKMLFLKDISRFQEVKYVDNS